MFKNFIDFENLLLGNEQWTQLEEKWGTPVDLDADEEQTEMPSELSTWDAKNSFNCSSVIKNMPSKVVRRSPNTGTLDYKDFIQDLKEKIVYQQSFVCGQMVSAASVEFIYDQIKDIYKSVERLYSTTSTVRRKPIPEMVSYTLSVDGLSLDDTPTEEDYIDEALETLSLLSNTYMTIEDKESAKSVTALVEKFSLMLAKPNCSPRVIQRYATKFEELREFWENLTEAGGISI